MQDACERPSSIGAPAKAEQEDVVAILVRIHEVTVAVPDCWEQTETKANPLTRDHSFPKRPPLVGAPIVPTPGW
jgi:2-methylcitrate dehydratase PrpD